MTNRNSDLLPDAIPTPAPIPGRFRVRSGLVSRLLRILAGNPGPEAPPPRPSASGDRSPRQQGAATAAAADLAMHLAAEAAQGQAKQHQTALIEALGVAVYTTDVEGRLTLYNEAAAALWGWRPPLGDQQWCGSWRLYWPDGTPLAHADCPMGIALREGRPVRGVEAVAEQPDGTRVPFIPYPTPLRDATGAVVGAVNVLVDLSDRKSAEAALAASEARFRAVFETTPECIKLVAPDGTLLQMNDAGLRIIEAAGPQAVEGRSIYGIIAPEHRTAWQANHERVCRGEALSWEFDIIGLRGRRRHMETHAAPLRLPDGRLAQLAITRDVTARRAVERQQVLLAREVDHRARNALTVALSLIRLTRAENPHHFAETVEGRVAALASAHALLSEEGWTGAELRLLAERELAAYLAAGRVVLSGPAVPLAPGAVQAVSVVLHELATNAAKYGALSAPEGRLDLEWSIQPGGGLRLVWTESGGPLLAGPPERRGFGSRLIEATVRGQLGGTVMPYWDPVGLRCEVTVAADRLLVEDEPESDMAVPEATGTGPVLSLAGRRVLVAEDEPLLALELEETLRGLGCEVLGPVPTLEEALHLAATPGRIDAAVLDINLAGRPSFPVADHLAGRDVPVVFATGYGDLPDGRTTGDGRGMLLRKPLGRGELAAALAQVLGPDHPPRKPVLQGRTGTAAGA